MATLVIQAHEEHTIVVEDDFRDFPSTQGFWTVHGIDGSALTVHTSSILSAKLAPATHPTTDSPWMFAWQDDGKLHVTVDTSRATDPVMEVVAIPPHDWTPAKQSRDW